MNTKRCPECTETKPLSEFGVCKQNNGVAPYCKPCTNAKSRAKYAANPERKAEFVKRWKENNGAVVSAIVKRHRASRVINTPSWADLSIMNEIYKDAKEFRDGGLDVHVDHIVPLQGEKVCGLHVHNNLTVKLAQWNAAKGNRFSV